MTISSTTTKISYLANGVTLAFAFPYLFLANGDLKVLVNSDTKTITTDYTVTGAGNPSGGTVNFVTAPADGHTVTILRRTPVTQTVDYVANDRFPAETHESALDKLTMQAQELTTANGLTLRYPDEEPTTSSGAIPNKDTRKGKSLGFDQDGQPKVYNIPETYGVYELPMFKVSDYTPVSTESRLEAALDALGGTSCVLYVDIVCRLSTFVTVPSNITLLVDGPKIEFTTGEAGNQGLTTESPIIAGRYPIFASIAETDIGDISLAGEIYPEWFGAVGDINITDDTQAFDYALGSSGFSSIRFRAGAQYMTTDDVTLTRSSVVLDLDGARITSIRKILVTGTSVRVLNLPPEAKLIGNAISFQINYPTSGNILPSLHPLSAAVTTANATTTTIATLAAPNTVSGTGGAFGEMEVTAYAVSPGGVLNCFRRRFLYQYGITAGVLNAQAVGTDLNPATLGGLSESASGTNILIRVTGAAATSVDWHVFIKVNAAQ